LGEHHSYGDGPIFPEIEHERYFGEKTYMKFPRKYCLIALVVFIRKGKNCHSLDLDSYQCDVV